jgi:CPA2 family monovalent cation:H+ antiporter-2
MGILGSIVLLLAVTVLTVAICRRLHLPTIIGYLAVGIAVGPFALALVPDNAQGRLLAEIGVVLMLFSIGLEFSLQELKAMPKSVWALGVAQLSLTTLAAGAAALMFNIGWQGALAIGAAVAISATSVGTKLLVERAELTSEHGKRVIAILLFQDIAVIPFLVLLPTLAQGGSLVAALGSAGVKAAMALALILGLGRPMVRWWMRTVAARRSPELFMLNILLVTLGLAWVTEHAGLSLALGAFIAGMLIAETEFRYQVEEDIKPFRDVLLGFFFITLGMQLDIPSILPLLHWVLALMGALMLLKFVIIAGVLKAMKTPIATNVRTAIFLSQAGEFSFVLVTLAGSLGKIPDTQRQVLLAAMVLSLLLSPLLISQSDRIVKKLTANDWMARAVALTQLAAAKVVRQDHVLICGYGRSGQFLARLLERENIAWMALDNDPQRVREAQAAGAPVSYGDASRAEALTVAGVAKAKALVVTFADTGTAKRILRAVQKVNASLPVIVRTTDEGTIEALLEAGATEVVPEVLEGALMLASQAMLTAGTPLNRVLKRIRAVREERYNLFQGFFHGASDTPETDDDAIRLHAFVLTGGARSIGMSITETKLPSAVTIQSVRRGGQTADHRGAEFLFQEGDRVVVLGGLTAIGRAKDALL